MELIQTKSLLAKLMATENIIVEQRNVNTASFDTKNRILTVPVLDSNISGYLYDLFMGHEVGHALYTPENGFDIAEENKIPKSIINVVEDSRIERKIKNKYPGIRSSFVRGYRELVEKDFFTTKDIDLNSMNFIDRVNMYTKGGPTQGILFSDVEKVLVDKVENTQTYDDVVAVSLEIVEYMKQEQEKKNEQMALEALTQKLDSSEMELDNSDDYDEIDNLPQDNSGDEESDEETDMDAMGGAGSDLGEESTITSHTDEAFRKNESKLFANNKTFYYGNIPSVDLDKAVVPYKVLWKRYDFECKKLQAYYQDLYRNNSFKVHGYDFEKLQKLRTEAKKVVSYLAKEFEMRKNADQLKRASVAKTGELNMSKIYSYGFAEDLFKKITVLPGGKSHGLIMFLDWSGSMGGHLENTVKQLISLILFCKKVNIPYEVYAFTSEYDELYHQTPKEGDLRIHPFKLLNLFSSKMSASELKNATAALISMAPYRGYRPRFFGMGGTPLTEAIISAMKIVPEFQKSYKLQIVNTVFLTDGDGHRINSIIYKNENGKLTDGYGEMSEKDSHYSVQKNLVIRDPITKEEIRCEQHRGRELTSDYIKMLKKRTNCNIVGFYVLGGREFGREVHEFFPRTADYDKLKSQFRKNKSIVVTSSGYDEYYLLRSEGLNTEDDVEFEVKENTTTRGLVSAFNKYAGNRLSSRVVLNRFIGMIS